MGQPSATTIHLIEARLDKIKRRHEVEYTVIKYKDGVAYDMYQLEHLCKDVRDLRDAMQHMVYALKEIKGDV